MWTRKDWFILVGLTAIGALFRFYRLGEIPPGFQFDEAFNAIDAQQVLAGNYPLFLPANGGREALYTYWQALWGALFGVDVFALRFSSALLGTLTVPATYATLRCMLRRDSRRIAAFTALVLAITLWHVQFSRYGIRVISMPLLLSGVFVTFWLGGHAGTRGRRLAAYAISGVLVGLTPWTHPTGRFVPFILIGYVLWLLLRRKEERRWTLDSLAGGLMITGGVAFLVFLPLGLEFIRHPEFFFGHASEVSVFADRVSGGSPAAHLLENVLRVAGMFFVAGDLDWTHNLAGRPVFDWLMGITFVIGLWLWIRRVVRTNDEDFDALSLLGLWALVMLLPTLLSEAAPNYSRALPALPALFLAAGLGLNRIAAVQRPAPWLGPALAGVIVLFSAVSTVYDYFVRFANDRAVYYTYDADKLDALEYLAALTDENRVFLSQLWGEKHATVYHLRGRMGIDSIDTADTLVLPPAGMGLAYGFPAEQHERAEEIAALWPAAELTDLTDPYGNHLITVVTVPAAAAAAWPDALTPAVEMEARFFEAPTLIGMQQEQGSTALNLFWRGDQPTFRDLTTFVHLIDQSGARVGQVDKLPANGSYRTPYWTVGDRLVDRYLPELTDLCAGGERARVVVGWYQYLADNQRMARTDAPGDSALAGSVTLPLVSYPAERFSLPLTFEPAGPAEGAGPALIGAEIHAGPVEPGAPLTVDLLWQGRAADHAGGDFSLLLARGDNELVLPPGTIPIASGAEWQEDEALCRRVRTHVPQGTASGRYDLVVRSATGDLRLGELQVAESTRLFTVPDVAEMNDAAFDGLIALRGHDLDVATDQANGEPAELLLTLVWQALVLPAGDRAVPHKVFVHVVDAAGDLIAQSDAEPAGGYGTDRWLPGEVVVDQHRIALPPDAGGQTLRVLVGLYEPVGGQRLAAESQDGTAYPDDAVPLAEITIP